MNSGESQFELATKEITDVNNEDAKEEKLKESITFREKLNKLRKFITVEPFLVLYYLSNALVSVPTQKFTAERQCIVDLNYTADICFKIVQTVSDNSTTTADVISAAGNMFTWKLPLEKLLPALLVLNIGAWSDRTGNRKSIIMVSLIGQFLSGTVYLVVLFLPRVPIWVISLIDSLILTLTGGLSVLFFGVFSHVADATEPELRTLKMAVIAVIATSFGILGELIAGLLTRSIGYTVPIVASLVCSILGALYAYFKIHDVNLKNEEGTMRDKIVNFLNPKNFFEAYSLFVHYKGRKLAQIILVLTGYTVIIGPPYGLIYTAYFYLLQRYSMNEAEFASFDSILQIINVIGTSVGVKIFTDTFKIHDCLLGVLSTLCRVSSYFIFAFAPDRTWLYVGAASDLFGNIAVTVIRSTGTKIVDPADIGKLLSILTFIDSLIALTAMPLYIQVWIKYINTFPGAAYLLGSMWTLPNFIVMISLYYIDKKQKKDVISDPDSKEKHTYDNEITSF